MAERIFDLIKAAQAGDISALDEVVRENDKLIWSVVKHFSMSIYEPEDLFQIGAIGLIKAVKKFDFTKDVQFSTYAVPTIMGEIRKFMRDDGIVKISRSIKEQATKIRHIANEHLVKTGENISVVALAERLDISPEDVAFALTATEMPVSIYQPVGGSDLTLAETIKSGGAFDEKIVETLAVHSVVELLPSRDKEIIQMRYYENKTQSEIADMLGISQVQVSRLEKKILSKLKEEIS